MTAEFQFDDGRPRSESIVAAVVAAIQVYLEDETGTTEKPSNLASKWLLTSRREAHRMPPAGLDMSLRAGWSVRG